MPEQQPDDRAAAEHFVRRSPAYRVAVWYLRSAMIGLPLSLIDLEHLWPVWPALVILGLICTLPVRYFAHFEWKLPQTDVEFMMWRDVFRPGFR